MYPLGSHHSRYPLAGAVVMLLVCAQANAQDTTRVTSRGEVSLGITYKSLVGAVTNVTPMAMKIETLTGLTPERIRLIDANDFLAPSNAGAFGALVARNGTGITALRTALQRNEMIVKALSDHPAKPVVGDVVAADITGDRGVVVYYWRRP
jgi:hypothetical protein